MTKLKKDEFLLEQEKHNVDWYEYLIPLFNTIFLFIIYLSWIINEKKSNSPSFSFPVINLLIMRNIIPIIGLTLFLIYYIVPNSINDQEQRLKLLYENITGYIYRTSWFFFVAFCILSLNSTSNQTKSIWFIGLWFYLYTDLIIILVRSNSKFHTIINLKSGIIKHSVSFPNYTFTREINHTFTDSIQFMLLKRQSPLSRMIPIFDDELLTLDRNIAVTFMFNLHFDYKEMYMKPTTAPLIIAQNIPLSTALDIIKELQDMIQLEPKILFEDSGNKITIQW